MLYKRYLVGALLILLKNIQDLNKTRYSAGSVVYRQMFFWYGQALIAKMKSVAIAQSCGWDRDRKVDRLNKDCPHSWLPTIIDPFAFSLPSSLALLEKASVVPGDHCCGAEQP